MRKEWAAVFIMLWTIFLVAESVWTIEINALDQGSITYFQDAPIRLNQVGRDQDDRLRFYHLSGGTQIMPYDWFVALEESDNPDRFTADHNLVPLRLIPSHRHQLHNPDNLPVGFAKTIYPNTPTGGKAYVGLTCAFCHTGQLDYTKIAPDGKTRKHYTIYIDGAPSMQDNFRFLRALLASLRATLADTAKFSRFAQEVLSRKGIENNAKNQEELKGEVAKFTALMLRRARIDTMEWGFGRFDALGRGSNTVFFNLDPDNVRHTNAPVSTPHIWNAHLYDWVQWSGSIQHPLARNIGQVIGVGAGLFESKDPARPWLMTRPADPFESSLEIENLKALEKLASSIKPPQWPEEIFGAIDRTLATKGKELYRKHCWHCHVPKPLQNPTRFEQRFHIWMSPRGDENKEERNEVGTDPTYLRNFASRHVTTGILKDDVGAESMSAGKLTQYVTTELLTRAGEDAADNTWNITAQYTARPHAGIWATPPFLHNGSVPNLYELLSPVEERTPCFYLGGLEFDPKLVGFVLRTCDFQSRPDNPYSGFELDTSRPGNSNAGHEFRNDDRKGHRFTETDCEGFSKGGSNGIIGCGLEPKQREAIIEYLKTCDLDEVTWNEDPKPKICRPEQPLLTAE